jgi:cation transport regulator ChaC
MVFDAKDGVKGSCEDYVRGIAKELSKMGINDPIVAELTKAISDQKEAR